MSLEGLGYSRGKTTDSRCWSRGAKEARGNKARRGAVSDEAHSTLWEQGDGSRSCTDRCVFREEHTPTRLLNEIPGEERDEQPGSRCRTCRTEAPHAGSSGDRETEFFSWVQQGSELSSRRRGPVSPPAREEECGDKKTELGRCGVVPCHR